MSMNKKQRAALKEMCGGRCAYCGDPLGDRWHADHVEPVVRYLTTGHRGSPVGQLYPNRNRDNNYKPACIPCNINKHSMDLETWRLQLEGLNDALLQYSANYRHALRFGLIAEARKPVVFYFERMTDRHASAAG